MNTDNEKKTGWKQKFIREMTEYVINFCYLAVFFSVFTFYRRLVLAEYEIAYLHYGISLIEAAILAKVIMIGQFIGLGTGMEEKPLIIPALHKAVVFSIFVALFGILEHMAGGLIHGIGLAGGINEILDKGKDEIFAKVLITFFAFIPFFAFRELGRVFGEGDIRKMFFRKGAIPGTNFTVKK